MKRLAAVFIVLLMTVAANFFIANRLLRGAAWMIPQVSGWMVAVLFVAIWVTAVMGLSPRWYKGKRYVNRFAAYWFGVYFYFLLLFLAAEILVIVGIATRFISRDVPPNIRFGVAVSVAAITALLLIIGRINAARIKLVSYDIVMKKRVAPGGLKIVMIADLHLGASNCEAQLSAIVQRINAMQPDIVCLVGDIFNDDIKLMRNPAAVMASLKGIHAMHGVVACLGNHDGGLTFADMTRFLADSNVQRLDDTYVLVDGRFVLVGRVDARPIFGFDGLTRVDTASVMASVKEAHPTLPVIVMEHNPTHLPEYGHDADLLLCGHTHKGQMFPFNFITGAVHPVNNGYYQKNADSPHIIVTSGVGTWGPPLRIGTSSEIVCIKIG